MRRREFVSALLAGAAANAGADVPVLLVTDKYAHSNIAAFKSTIWRQALNVFSKSLIVLDVIERPGAVLEYPSGRPRFIGLDRSRINIVLADRVPLDWDKGRSLAGVSAVYEGYCVCVISMQEAHPNRIPFLSTNTVVHELLHVLLGDVFTARTGFINGQTSEARVDTYATLLWTVGGGSVVRAQIPGCLRHLHELVNPGSRKTSG